MRSSESFTHCKVTIAAVVADQAGNMVVNKNSVTFFKFCYSTANGLYDTCGFMPKG